jgi:hypothetical protein
MSSCYKTSDNKFFGCPPRMADGRHFTDYRPNCYVNNLIKAENGIQNSFQYRLFLSQNGAELMDINRNHACLKNCCTPCGEPFNVGTMLPEVNKWVCDKHSCRLIGGDPNGLGTGRQYSPEVKCDNLPSSWPVQQNLNSCVSPQELSNYYPLDQNVYNSVQRLTVQGGARPVREGGDPRTHQ